MRSMTGKHTLQTLLATVLLTASAAPARNINAVNGGMPNRISMNVTVPKQTQGTTFGEKVNPGMSTAKRGVDTGASTIVIECGEAACAVVFPVGGGIRADLAAMTFSPLAARQASELRKGSPGASLLGGVLPGGSIASAAFTKAPLTADGEAGAATGSMAEGTAVSTRSIAPGVIDVVDALPDGDYLLTFVVKRATPGLNDTVKTQVRTAQLQRVRIVVGFNVEAGVAKARHDIAMNSVRNMR